MAVSPADPGHRVGSAVAIEGNFAVVGANMGHGLANPNPGTAYVLERDSVSGTWSQVSVLSASNAVDFGFAVDMEPGRIVVGAQGEGNDKGAIYLFEPNAGGNWIQTQRIPGPPNSSGYFGASVALSGDQLIVGAPKANNRLGQQTGAAYIYEFDAQSNDFQFVKKIIASDGVGGDLFGIDVDIEAGTAVVGAFQKSLNGFANAGAAYVFDRSASGNPSVIAWTETQALIGANTVGGDAFGLAVSIGNGEIAVGAPMDKYLDPEGVFGASQITVGSVNIFKLGIAPNPTAWTETELITPSEIQFGLEFGAAIELDGNRLVVGAAGYRDPHPLATGGLHGTAYIYERTSFTPEWAEMLRLKDTLLPKNLDRLGFSVAISGDGVLLGAPQEDMSLPVFETGSAHFYELPPILSFLKGTPNGISLSAGGTMNLAMDFGSLGANKQVNLYSSFSLTALDGVNPLVPFPASDPLYQLSLAGNLPSQVFLNFSTTLDGNGKGLASIVLPPLVNSSSVGMTIYTSAQILELDPLPFFALPSSVVALKLYP